MSRPPRSPLPTSTDRGPEDPGPASTDEYFSSWRGRRTRPAGTGTCVCDSIELERQEAQHWLLRLLLGYPFLGPVPEVLDQAEGSRVLDVATGTGVWAIDMAERFPGVEVVGCDNVPMQQE